MPDEEEVTDDVNIADDLGEEEQIPFRYSITSYGADFALDTILKRMDHADITIPSFQRGFVWGMEKSSRFIESLLLGLPVPGIFLSKDPETQQLIVIDGQQRLRTIQFFYKGYFKEPDVMFSLKGIDSEFKDVTYNSLRPEDKRRLNNSILHATIVQQDEPSEDNSSVYLIFERLNTGGMMLRPQEIRACIYHGILNELLGKLNKNPEWREIFGKVHTRMRDQELILRFFALYFYLDRYASPMKEFLNRYMARNKRLQYEGEGLLTEKFVKTIRVFHQSLGDSAFKPFGMLNAAVFDAAMVGLTRRLEQGDISDFTALKARYGQLMANRSFLTAIERSTADPDNVKRRIHLATSAFADVG